MSCAKPKCRNKADEPMVCCWLCDSMYHGKCVELAARTVDNLREDKGLRWCCKNCKAYDVEFFSFFKNSRDELEKINNDLQSLSQKFLNYKKLLEKLPNSPKRKRATVVANSNFPLSNKSTNTEPDNLNDVQFFAPSTSTQRNLPSSHSQLPKPSTAQTLAPAVPVFENKNAEIETLNSKSPRYTSIIENSPTDGVMPISGQCADMVTSNSIPPQYVIESGSENGVLPINEEQRDLQPVARELRIIPPRKSIFISRFASDTSVVDIDYYLKSKLRSNANITTYKFSYSQPRSIASFKITVPFEYFDKIIDPCFWPDNALVREFVYRENPRINNNVARLPVGEQIYQKNSN